jgi:hypothetical protein
MMNSSFNLLRSGAISIVQVLLYSVFTLELSGAIFTAVGLWIYRAGFDSSLADARAIGAILILMSTAPSLSLSALWKLDRGKSSRCALFLATTISLLLRSVLIIASFAAVQLPWTSELLGSKKPDLIAGSLFAAVLLVLVFGRTRHTRAVSPP